MTQHNVKNILAIYQLATADERVAGRQWYPTAKAIAVEIAARYDIPANQAVGILAALSPRNTWSKNIENADALISAYVNGGREQAEAVKVCTFGANRAKAIKILESGFETLPEILDILSGPKLRAFATNIAGDLIEVTVDGHAYCIWHGSRVSLKDVPSIGKKLRAQIKEDYTAAAEKLGVAPAEAQSVTWTVWRRIHLGYGTED